MWRVSNLKIRELIWLIAACFGGRHYCCVLWRLRVALGACDTLKRVLDCVSITQIGDKGADGDCVGMLAFTALNVEPVV